MRLGIKNIHNLILPNHLKIVKNVGNKKPKTQAQEGIGKFLDIFSSQLKSSKFFSYFFGFKGFLYYKKS